MYRPVPGCLDFPGGLPTVRGWSSGAPILTAGASLNRWSGSEGCDLGLDSAKDGGHAVEALRRDRLLEAHLHVEVVGNFEDLLGRGAVECLSQDAREATNRWGLGRNAEEEVYDVAILLGDQGERRLALWNHFEQLRILGEAIGEFG